MSISSHKWTIAGVVMIGVVLIWNYQRAPDHVPGPEVSSPPPQVAEATPPPAKIEPPGSLGQPPASSAAPDHAAPATAPPAVRQKTALVFPGSTTEIPVAAEDISEDLSAVDGTIRSFRDVHGQNPIGTNAEITGALLGNNLKQIKLELPAGSQLNGDGEMCDRWGTPYFFHQISGTEMEIRSAGPDREMWTEDDSQL